MREYLFRGKLKINNEWAYSRCPDGTLRSGVVKHDFIPETVGQFTGLTDKNGTKIFEGDILSEKGYLFVVVWNQGWAQFRLSYIGRCIQYPEWNRGVQMEIVGNIHDNPELLEG